MTNAYKKIYELLNQIFNLSFHWIKPFISSVEKPFVKLHALSSVYIFAGLDYYLNFPKVIYNPDSRSYEYSIKSTKKIGYEHLPEVQQQISKLTLNVKSL